MGPTDLASTIVEYGIVVIAQTVLSAPEARR
jgi:hypothetical protein